MWESSFCIHVPSREYCEWAHSHPEGTSDTSTRLIDKLHEITPTIHPRGSSLTCEANNNSPLIISKHNNIIAEFRDVADWAVSWLFLRVVRFVDAKIQHVPDETTLHLLSLFRSTREYRCSDEIKSTWPLPGYGWLQRLVRAPNNIDSNLLRFDLLLKYFAYKTCFFLNIRNSLCNKKKLNK